VLDQYLIQWNIGVLLEVAVPQTVKVHLDLEEMVVAVEQAVWQWVILLYPQAMLLYQSAQVVAQVLMDQTLHCLVIWYSRVWEVARGHLQQLHLIPVSMLVIPVDRAAAVAPVTQ
jgi:hypothetical protein